MAVDLDPEDLEQLVERVDRLEDALEDEREERQRLEDELEQERERRRELEDALEDVPDLLEDRTPEDEDGRNFSDIWLAGAPVGKLINRTKDRVNDLEKKVEDSTDPEEPAPLEENAPPIYDVLRTPRSRLEGTERRTHFIWSDLTDYAAKTPKGYVLAASDARRVLAAAEPDDSPCTRIDPNHVGRVFDLSVDLTRGAAFVRKNEDGERQLVVPTGWEDEARAAADDAAVT